MLRSKNTLLLNIHSLLFVLSLSLIFFPMVIRAEKGVLERQSPNQQNAQKPSYVPNEILVKYKSNQMTIAGILGIGSDKAPSIHQLDSKYGLVKSERTSVAGRSSIGPVRNQISDTLSIYKLSLKGGADIETATKEYSADSNVEFAQPNYIYSTQEIPNDPNYGSLWGMTKINAPSAWDLSVGSSSVTVAVIDTGVDYNHEDLSANIWNNPRETGVTQFGDSCWTGTAQDKATNSCDDDNNGLVDDWHGWNYVADTNNPADDNGHGTHVSGTIAAVGNNSKGVVGVCPNCKIMPLKFADSTGVGDSLSAAYAIRYAADQGAKVINNSWGASTINDPSITSAITYAHNLNVVVVAAAGNNSSDAYTYSPANVNDVITVSATDSSDQLASFSNSGAKVDVAAPGVGIESTYLNNSYTTLSGTSMAAPHVSGLAALLLSNSPSLTSEQVRQILRSSSDDLGTLGWDTAFGAGRINAHKTLTSTQYLTSHIETPSPGDVPSAMFTITGSATGLNFASYKLDYAANSDMSTWMNIASSVIPVVSGSLGTLDVSNFVNGVYVLRITSTDTQNNAYFQYTYFSVQATPVSPHNFHAGATDRGASLTWQVSVAGISPISGYEIFRSTTPGNYSINPTATVTGTSFNDSALTNGTTYYYKVRAKDSQNSPFYSSFTQELAVCPGSITTKTGWPKVESSMAGLSHVTTTTPVYSDINSDGQKELVFLETYLNYDASQPESGSVLCVWDSSGYNIQGFPLQIPDNVSMNPTVADINGDGYSEIIFETYKTSKVYVVDHSGQILSGWPKQMIAGAASDIRDNHAPSVAVGDINGDNKLEVVAGAGNNVDTHLYAWDLSGNVIPGFPVTLTAYSFVAPELADINHDGKDEIIASSLYQYSSGNYYVSYITILNGSGQNISGWPINIGHDSYPSPVVVSDINNDGTPDIIFAAGDKAYVYEPNGSLLSGWPVNLPNVANYNNFQYASPAIGDVDGDGFKEIIFRTLGSWTNGYETDIYKYNGSLSASVPDDNQGTSIPYSISNSSPVLGDVDNDGNPDIIEQLIHDDGTAEVRAWNGTGALIAGFPVRFQTQNLQSSPLLADVDGDHKLDLIVTANTQINVFNLPNAAPTSMWPTFLGNSRRTGFNEAGTIDKFGSYMTVSEKAPSLGEAVVLKVMIQDIAGNPVSGKAISVSKGSGNPGTITPVSSQTNSDGVAVFTLASGFVGNMNLTAIDVTDSVALPVQQTVVFDYGSVTNFVLNTTETVTAGQNLSISVTAVNQYGTEISTFMGPITITSDDPTAQIPQDLGEGWSNGGATFILVLKKAGMRPILVRNSTGSPSASAVVTVKAASLDHINFSPNTTQTINAGQSIQFSAQGQDKYNNDITGLSYTWIGLGDLIISSSNSFGNNFSSPGTYNIHAASGSVNSPTVTVNVNNGPPPVAGPSYQNVYRFWNVNGTHFYTASDSEKNNILSRWPSIYRFEGVAYNINVNSQKQMTPLYRLWNSNGTHFYTASYTEAINAVQKWPSIYKLEGVAYNVTMDSTGIPVYRFYNSNGTHFYTASPAERDNVITKWPGQFHYEGIAYYLPN